MGMTPPPGTANELEVLVLDRRSPDTSLPSARVPQGSLRFGGLALDTRTGITYWRGRLLDLSLTERELLTALLRRAGQIISREHFAVLLGDDVETIDARVNMLRTHLQHEGVTCLPCEASGVGYILWRC